MRQKIASTILELREAKGWSRREAAKQIGITYALLNEIEFGRKMPGEMALTKMSKTFKLTKREEVELFCGAGRIHPEVAKVIVNNPDKAVNLIKNA